MRSLASPDDEPSLHGVCAAEFVDLRPIGIDDWSDVRYVHATSFRTTIGPRISDQCLDEFIRWVDTPAYVDHFRSADPTGAWLDGRLAGTVGWRPADPCGDVARIEGLFVRPLFAFMGLGSLLLAHAEAQARGAGYARITALASAVSVPFFMRAGYDVYAQGPGISEFAGDMPVFIMRKPERAARTVVGRVAGAMPLQPAVVDEDLHPGLVPRAAPQASELLVED